ncbi:MAG: hypothetical protein ACYTGV_06125 [Planctomycetota bacterium]
MTSLLCLVAACVPLAELVDDVTLTEAELQDIQDNYEGAMRAFGELAEFAGQVGDGTVDISTSEYTPPTAENDWIGSLRYLGTEFPGGEGELTLSFTVLDEAENPIDPFETDLANDTLITADFEVSFVGLTSEGAPLDFHGVFTSTLDRSDPAAYDVEITGTFTIGHNDYVAAFEATAFKVTYDAATNEPQSADGAFTGSIDIPDFAFDADVDIRGLGADVSVLIQVLDQTVEDSVVDLASFMSQMDSSPSQ